MISKRVEELFEASSNLPEAERAAYLDTACGDDVKVRLAVESLLTSANHADSFLSDLSSRLGLQSVFAGTLELPRTESIGAYRLVRLIARGGMGAVYLAERADAQFEKQVALKVLPIGVGGATAHQRFLAERQILARLVHPHIARLLDGGITEDGTPYFVMDYVDGVAIDRYCAEQKPGIPERLQLLLQVTDAVQFAHRNLIIHRDLKPANVLVDENDNVRLLDFGIAKIVEPGAYGDHLTRVAQRPATPSFSSPEMLRGETVDVTTDVYSLGVLLFQLVTDRLPIVFEGLSPAEAISQAESTLPPPVSSIRTGLSTDLDAIVFKALAKDPAERYTTVESFAADIEAFLDGRAVAAKAPTFAYRMKKFTRRNRIAIATTTIVATIIIGTSNVAMLQSIEANRQRDLALLEQQQLQATNEFFGFLMEEMGSQPLTSVELLDHGAELLQKQYGVENAFMGRILFEVSRRYANLNERTKQIELLHQAESLARQYADQDLLATVQCRLATIHGYDDADLAEGYAREGNKIYSTLRHPSVDASMDCLRMNAHIADRAGDVSTAIDLLLEAKAILDSNPSGANHRATLLGHLSHVYFTAGRIEASLANLDEVLAYLESTGKGNSFGYLRVAANRAVVLNVAGRLDESLVAWEYVTKLRQGGYERRGTAFMLGEYASSLTRVGRMKEAESAYLEGIGLAEAAGDMADVAYHHLGLVAIHLAENDFEQAHASIDAAQEFFLRESVSYGAAARNSKVMRAKVFRNEGELPAALAEMRRVLDEARYPDVGYEPGLISALIETAEIHRYMENYDEAEVLATDIIARLKVRSTGEDTQNVDVGRAHIQRAEIRTDSGDYSGARNDFEIGIPILQSILGAEHKETVDAQALMGRFEQPSSL